MAAVLDTPREDTGPLMLVCANTSHRIGRSASAPLQGIPASIVALAQMQLDGWTTYAPDQRTIASVRMREWARGR